MEPVTILYADDDENDVFFMQRAAEKLALPIVLDVADDGTRVIEYLRQKTPAVALLDFRMPLMSGLEVLRLMREREALSSPIPVIIFSSSTVGRDVEASYRLGAVAFIEKPVGTPALLKLLRSIYKCARSGPDPSCWEELHGRVPRQSPDLEGKVEEV
jgi:CheY-like chemotaxis protein